MHHAIAVEVTKSGRSDRGHTCHGARSPVDPSRVLFAEIRLVLRTRPRTPCVLIIALEQLQLRTDRLGYFHVCQCCHSIRISRLSPLCHRVQEYRTTLRPIPISDLDRFLVWSFRKAACSFKIKARMNLRHTVFLPAFRLTGIHLSSLILRIYISFRDLFLPLRVVRVFLIFNGKRRVCERG